MFIHISAHTGMHMIHLPPPSLFCVQVGLMVIDEIHLLGADRGPILEVIVSRMRYIAEQTERAIRFVGLSTALANAQ